MSVETEEKPVIVDKDNPAAPFGRDIDGEPLAPLGFKADGKTPRISNRGRKAGTSIGSVSRTTSKAKAATKANEVDQRRKELLVSLTDMFVSTPLAGASLSPALRKRIGDKHTGALAGDAVILSTFMPHVADGLVVLSQSKPSVMSWLDSVEEKAPYLMLAQVGMQMTKAFISNHLNPDERLANAGRLAAQMRVAKMAQDIEDEARAMGVSVDQMAEAA